ncbi:MAG: 1,4-dihydroxy-2-naphthoate polyprenyltransferase [Burkholderiaceae bacterium]|jgi:1,4-dihydroxy-2-naphthoate octaprenyltransferase|nr:1,4-dihydroxy-2-naphthoate polyprenyltransferase [Burkholderiaceae bacterium]
MSDLSNQAEDRCRPAASLPLGAWLRSLRLGTLLLSGVAVAQGCALAAWRGAFDPVAAALALLTALLLQILCNLANDYGDVGKGSDGPARIGPRRGLHTGAITPAQMRAALWLCGGLCLACGAALIVHAARTPGTALLFVLLGLGCIAAALGYTLGRYAYGYLGLGDLSVLVFFGWTGVAGSFALQAGHIDALVFWPASACGLFAVAVLNINNLRDIDADAQAGKKTLAVRLGAWRARCYHVALLALALLCLAIFALLALHGWSRWLFLLALPWLVLQARHVYTHNSPEAMRFMLVPTVRAALLTQMLFMVGLSLHH